MLASTQRNCFREKAPRKAFHEDVPARTVRSDLLPPVGGVACRPGHAGIPLIDRHGACVRQCDESRPGTRRGPDERRLLAERRWHSAADQAIRHTPVPIRLVVLLDVSESMVENVLPMREGVEHFLTKLHPDD